MKFLSFVNKNKLLIFIGILAATSIFSIKGCITYKNNYTNIIQAIKNKDSQITYWKNKDSIEHAVANETLITKEGVIALYKGKLQELAKSLDIKNKQITNYISIIESTSGKIDTKIDTVWADTIQVLNGKDSIIKVPTYSGIYKDRWITFDMSIKKDMFHANYFINDSLNIIGFWKPSGFLNLGKRNYFIDISSANLNAHVENSTNFKITNSTYAEHKLGFGIIGGYGMTMQLNPQFTPFIGVGVFYKLF